MFIPKIAKEWAIEMDSSDDGRQILTNVKREKNVEAAKGTSFFEKLASSYLTTENPGSHMNNVLLSFPEFGFLGPLSGLSDERLTRFGFAERLPEQPDLRRRGVSFQQLKRRPGLLGTIRTLSLGNRRGIVWAALDDPVERDLKGGVSVSVVIDRLGLMKELEQAMYRIAYSAAEIGNPCQTPTVLDAGANPKF